MKKLNYLSVFLAAALQLTPLLRTICASPAASSTFAIILRWSIGTAATLGAVDAMSGATTVVFTTPTNFSGTVGTYFTNFVALTNNGGDPGAYFYLNNSNTFSAKLVNNSSTTSCMPAGLTFTMHDGGNPRYIYGAIYGTPTAPVTNRWVHILAGYASETPAVTDIYFTFLPASTSPPAITNQPVSRTNLVGSTATFTVTAGPPPLSYQWRFNTNTIIVGATNATLTLTNLQLSNAGSYMAIITNNAGSITSAVAKLIVWQAPLISNPPVGATNLAGTAATFSTVATGTEPLNYQWFFNATTAIPDSTNASLNIPNARLSQAGIYTVVVSNVAGSVTSSPATLAVLIPPAPTVQFPQIAGNLFTFRFTPVLGLTNTVQTNGQLGSGVWGILTNIAPPATSNSVVVNDVISDQKKFYRVMFAP